MAPRCGLYHTLAALTQNWFAHSTSNTQADPPEEPVLFNEVIETNGGIRDDLRVTFQCNEKLFEILLSIQSPEGSVEREYLRRLDGPLEACQDAAEEIFEELYNHLARLCRPFYRKYASAAPTKKASYTLYDHIYREMIPLRMHTKDDRAYLEMRGEPSLSMPSTFPLTSSNRVRLFKSSELKVQDVICKDRIYKVESMGSTFCAKIMERNSSIRPLEREIKILQQIERSGKGLKLRIPRVGGLIVEENDSNKIIGVLISFVDTRRDKPHLMSQDIHSTPKMTREIWAADIDRTLRQLHQMDIIWSDVKAANVLIDIREQPWIIDFGGGYTDGWVPADLADSKQGDLAGLKRIIEFLGCNDS
ncbi:MAG: hypothetical protein Q9217_006780 [Psora testacea]